MTEIRENFCPVCLAAPLAMAGVGVTTVGATEEENKKKEKQKHIMIWGGVILTILSIGGYFYFRRTCKDCK